MRFRADGMARDSKGELVVVQELRACREPHPTKLLADGRPMRCTRKPHGPEVRHTYRRVKPGVWWTRRPLSAEVQAVIDAEHLSASREKEAAPAGRKEAGVQEGAASLAPAGKRLRVLGLFSGLEGFERPFKRRGHEVITLDYDPEFGSDLCLDIREFAKDPQRFLDEAAVRLGYIQPGEHWLADLVIGGPDCRGFSILVVGDNWEKRDGAWRAKPGSVAELGIQLVDAALSVVLSLSPRWWVLENPRGMMRTLPQLRGVERRRITYCQYGAAWQKPTDLFGVFPAELQLKQPCQPGDKCHESAPRGSGRGIAGVKGKWAAAERALVPDSLAMDLCLAFEAGRSHGKEATGLSAFGVVEAESGSVDEVLADTSPVDARQVRGVV